MIVDTFDISGWAILKVVLAGISIYVISPALFVLRDFVVLKIIEKWIVTESLLFNISVCESDRWYLNKGTNETPTLRMGVFSPFGYAQDLVLKVGVHVIPSLCGSGTPEFGR